MNSVWNDDIPVIYYVSHSPHYHRGLICFRWISENEKNEKLWTTSTTIVKIDFWK